MKRTESKSFSFLPALLSEEEEEMDDKEFSPFYGPKGKENQKGNERNNKSH
jgi:hypothetical protein